MGPRGRGTAVASAPTTPSGTSTASHTATAKPLTVEPAGATLTGATQPVMTSSHQQGAPANTGRTRVAPPPPSTAISADTTIDTATIITATAAAITMDTAMAMATTMAMATATTIAMAIATTMAMAITMVITTATEVAATATAIMASATMATTLDNCWLGSDPMLPQTINLQLTLSSSKTINFAYTQK